MNSFGLKILIASSLVALVTENLFTKEDFAEEQIGPFLKLENICFSDPVNLKYEINWLLKGKNRYSNYDKLKHCLGIIKALFNKDFWPELLNEQSNYSFYHWIMALFQFFKDQSYFRISSEIIQNNDLPYSIHKELSNLIESKFNIQFEKEKKKEWLNCYQSDQFIDQIINKMNNLFFQQYRFVIYLQFLEVQIEDRQFEFDNLLDILQDIINYINELGKKNQIEQTKEFKHFIVFLQKRIKNEIIKYFINQKYCQQFQNLMPKIDELRNQIQQITDIYKKNYQLSNWEQVTNIQNAIIQNDIIQNAINDFESIKFQQQQINKWNLIKQILKIQNLELKNTMFKYLEKSYVFPKFLKYVKNQYEIVDFLTFIYEFKKILTNKKDNLYYQKMDKQEYQIIFEILVSMIGYLKYEHGPLILEKLNQFYKSQFTQEGSTFIKQQFLSHRQIIHQFLEDENQNIFARDVFRMIAIKETDFLEDKEYKFYQNQFLTSIRYQDYFTPYVLQNFKEIIFPFYYYCNNFLNQKTQKLILKLIYYTLTNQLQTMQNWNLADYYIGFMFQLNEYVYAQKQNKQIHQVNYLIYLMKIMPAISFIFKIKQIEFQSTHFDYLEIQKLNKDINNNLRDSNFNLLTQYIGNKSKPWRKMQFRGICQYFIKDKKEFYWQFDLSEVKRCEKAFQKSSTSFQELLFSFEDLSQDLVCQKAEYLNGEFKFNKQKKFFQEQKFEYM